MEVQEDFQALGIHNLAILPLDTEVLLALRKLDYILHSLLQQEHTLEQEELGQLEYLQGYTHHSLDIMELQPPTNQGSCQDLFPLLECILAGLLWLL